MHDSKQLSSDILPLSATCSSLHKTPTRPVSVRNRFGDATSVLDPGCAQPVAAGPHDDGNGKTKDEDDALTVPGFNSPARRGRLRG